MSLLDSSLPFDRSLLPIMERRLASEIEMRRQRRLQGQRGGLIEFVRYFWKVLEPQTHLVDGWPLEAICLHLEAVTFGEIKRLLMNVPPGFMKSLLTDVFWPAWEWGAMDMPHLRYVAFSYSAALTERDNGKFRDLILSPEYQEMWGHRFDLRKIGETKVTNDKTGSKLATSVGGIGTGERGDRVIVDDPHNVKEGESEVVRSETVRWFREALSNRLNDMDESAIVIIMQRVHEDDVSGVILRENEAFDYVQLRIQMEYETGWHCETSIGWADPRTEENDLAWPERFSEATVDRIKFTVGPYAYAAQYRQSPEPRGGGILKRDYWQVWDKDEFPQFDYILVSADTAFTEKEENDPTGCTVWGLFREGKYDYPKVMLLWAWRKHLELHGQPIAKLPGESDAAHQRRSQPSWGIVEWLMHTCRRFKADKLLIESKASGKDAQNAIQRLHAFEGYGVQLTNPDGDKTARMHAVEPILATGLVFAPDREWADMVIDEAASAPKGRYKDLTDSMTQALKFLRAQGLIAHSHEVEAADYETRLHRGRELPLYDA